MQLLSVSNEKVDMLDTHMLNHAFGEYEVMARINKRQHSVECQGVVIAFYIAPDHFLQLCEEYPALEEEMWKRAAVTAAKVRLTEQPHDYRHRFTRDLRIAFQNGKISSPTLRHAARSSGTIEVDGSEVVKLSTKNDHIFFLRTQYKPVTHHRGSYKPNSAYSTEGDAVTVGRAYAVMSGPNNTVRIRDDEVAIIYTLDVSKMKHGVGRHHSLISQSSKGENNDTNTGERKEERKGESKGERKEEITGTTSASDTIGAENENENKSKITETSGGSSSSLDIEMVHVSTAAN